MTRSLYKLKAGRFSIELGNTTKIMGILNITPDSFSADGLWPMVKKDLRRVVALAQDMVEQGADILDVGGESTRPGALPVSAADELQRVIPLIKVLSKKISIPISVDTSKAIVAQAAIDVGAVIVNNIQGISADRDLLRCVAKNKVAVVLMHMRGTPQTMSALSNYQNLILDIKQDFRRAIKMYLHHGVAQNQIILDPGIGFAKSADQCVELLASLKKFSALKYPLLVGPSRKSFLGKILGKDSSQRLYGTLAAVSAAIFNGAHMIRVHDVAAVKDVARVLDSIVTHAQNSLSAKGQK